MVTASTLEQFKAHSLAVFSAINTGLQTDQHLADAEKTVKWCGEVEERLEAAKQHALSQTENIDALFRTIDEITVRGLNEFQRSGVTVRDFEAFQVAHRPPRKEPPPRKQRYNGADHRKYVEEEEDLALLKRIEAMRDVGVSHFKAEKLTGINRTVIRRIVQKYGLDYPSSSRAK